ncbi:LysR family transcriptional regulator [Candidatus Solirubrobacter pratensis]|uniref:LysR family transcriptional regulator n=1 Tax=Candidatus Solirubrobacter pratensis TaxID=1298857 RepID=UPI00041F8F63|nr:LysR family transcriptional regulator [Candidatus Solirubrobacter pratensis]
MDPRRVLTFRAVATERSFSSAARALSLTQPAVSQQVAALEKEIGARLLAREPGGLELTAAGKVLLEHADAIAERLELAATQLAELSEAARMRLRVGAFPSALACLVPKAVARLHEQAPGAEVLIEEGGSEALAERVARGELHAAVGFQDSTLPRREHEGVERRDLLHEPFLVALPPGHRLAALDSVPVSALADEPWTAPSGSHLIARTCRAAGFEPRLVSILRDPLAMRALVSQGLAVTLVPRLVADALEGIELRPIEGPGPERDVYAMIPAGGRHPLAESIVAAFAAVAAQL